MPMLPAALIAAQAYQVPRSMVAPMAMAAPLQCPARPPLPGDLAGWRTVMAEPGVGRAFLVRAIDPSAVRLAVPLDVARHPGRIALATIAIARPGAYQVAIDQAAWIDLFAADRTALTSAAHRHGPDCTGIRKIVTFTLAPGRYTLGLSGVAGAAVRVLVTPAAR